MQTDPDSPPTDIATPMGGHFYWHGIQKEDLNAYTQCMQVAISPSMCYSV
jgi:hypothetical protein